MTAPETVEEYLERVHVEWNTYHAIHPIVVDGVRAAQVGDPIPVSNVELYGYLEQGLVARNDGTPTTPAVTEPVAAAVTVASNDSTTAAPVATEAVAADIQNGIS